MSAPQTKSELPKNGASTRLAGGEQTRPGGQGPAAEPDGEAREGPAGNDDSDEQPEREKVERVREAEGRDVPSRLERVVPVEEEERAPRACVPGARQCRPR